MRILMDRFKAHWHKERGQSIVIFALSLVALLLFAGLAVDMGVIFIGREELSRGVDAAVLAGATELPRSGKPGADIRAQQYLDVNKIDFETGLAGFESDGAAGAAAAVLDAVQAGRPAPGEVGPPADADGELEDIGASAVAPTAMNERVKRTYLKEIIIQLKLQDKQLARARVGLDRWQHRYRLARDVGDATLSHEARVRVDGLERIVARLQREVAQLAVLRERFSRKGEVRAADRETAARFMSAEAAAALDRMSAHGSAQDFAHLELDDALSRLKRRLDGDSSR